MTTTGGFVARNKRRDERLITAQELSHRRGWDPMTVFHKADSGEILGAVWGRTLRFKEEEIEAWLRPPSRSEIEETLTELEQEGLLKSFLNTTASDVTACLNICTSSHWILAEEYKTSEHSEP